MLAESAMPTAERLRHAGGAFEIGGNARSGRIVRMLDPLQQLFSVHQLTETQHGALIRLRAHWSLGLLSGSMGSLDLDRVRQSGAGSREEQCLLHREAFRLAWARLTRTEREVVYTVVLTEGGLTSAGAVLGYRSPYHGRMAALALLRSSGETLAKLV
jgi:hypothetical protein